LGIKKANTKIWQLFVLGILAGLYISIGGHLFLVAIEQGMSKIVGGAVFSVGLFLVVIAGAELFTGNIIMIVGSISGLYTIIKLFKNWIIVYIGNFIGSILFALLIYKSGLFGTFDNLNNLGLLAIKVADYKLSIPFIECFIRGFFCNILVVLAIIMSFIAKDLISKIFCCILPIMAFVACGFEHCVANMFLIPVGLLAKGESLLVFHKMFINILPVTLGNILGGIFILIIHPNRIRQIKYLFKKRKILSNK
jgi:formate/nitrite transporter